MVSEALQLQVANIVLSLDGEQFGGAYSEHNHLGFSEDKVIWKLGVRAVSPI